MTTENIENNYKPENEKTPSPPYISFLTFQNFITWLETEGVPLKFDRSFWDKKYSGSLGMQLMAGLRFLGLLKGELTQPVIEEIVKAKGEDRKKLLAELFRKAYSTVDFNTLERATPAMLNDMFKSFELAEGSTLRKAVSFFINGCKAYDIPISKTLKKIARNKKERSGTKPIRKQDTEKKLETEQKSGSDSGQTKIENPLGNQAQSSAQQQTFKLLFPSGCEITLGVNLTIFDMSAVEMACIKEIGDVMKKYKEK